MSDRPTRSIEPNSRESRIGDAMTEAMAAHPEYDDRDRAIILYIGSEWNATILTGYETEADEDDIEGHLENASADAVVDMFLHLRAIFAAAGKELTFIPIGEKGRG